MLLAANARRVFLYRHQARQHFRKAIYPGFRRVRKIHQTISGKLLLFSTALRACLE